MNTNYNNYLAKQMISLFVAILVVSFFFCSAHAEQVAIIKSKTGEEGTALFEDTAAPPVGYYYNDLRLQVLEEKDGFSFIKIGDDTLSVEGYMKSDDLVLESPREWRAPGIQAGYISCKKSAILKEMPTMDAMEIGELANGTAIQVVGRYNDCYQIYNGSRNCFVSCENVVLSVDRLTSNIYGDLPEIGYLFPLNEENSVLRRYPSLEFSPTDGLQAFYSYPSSPLELIADLGAWYQVRVQNISTYYYLQKADAKQVILLSDWISDTDTDIEAGSYQAGRDMSAGLYTYVIPENQTGTLQIATTETQYSRTIRATGPAYYTLFIPQGAYVTVESSGELHGAKDFLSIVSSELTYSGNGMFFIGLQFPSFSIARVGINYRFIAQKDGGGISAYNIDGSLLESHTLKEGECYDANCILLNRSRFVEINNCKIEFLFDGNG